MFSLGLMRDSVSQLAGLLGQVADVLQPFVTSHRARDRVWNGQEYAPAAEALDADPAVAASWATAFTAAHLIVGQSSLAPAQHRFLQQQLFGGMGSLNDLCLDSTRWGSKAAEANRELEIIRTALYTCFQTITPREAKKT